MCLIKCRMAVEHMWHQGVVCSQQPDTANTKPSQLIWVPMKEMLSYVESLAELEAGRLSHFKQYPYPLPSSL